MIRNISVGIDIGTSATRVVVGEFVKGEKNPKIIGIGESETKGMHHGYIIHPAETFSSLKTAITMAERNAKVRIRRAFISIGSTSLRSEVGTGTAIISKADSEVTKLDINKALDECELNLAMGNKKILHAFPLSFKLDGKEVQGRPEGMRGNKLEIKALFITCSTKHWEDLIKVVTSLGIEPIDVVAGILASSNIALSNRHKMVGSALIDIGAETVSLGVFENELLIYLYTFSTGSEDITNDIALGLKIPIEKAESLKLGNADEEYPKKKLDEIIEARLEDIFDGAENYLKKIKRSGLLPAGVVFVGGGANTNGIEDLSKKIFNIPSKIGSTDFFGTAKTKLRDPSWFTALGLIIGSHDSEEYIEGSFSNLVKDLKYSLKSIVKQLMP